MKVRSLATLATRVALDGRVCHGSDRQHFRAPSRGGVYSGRGFSHNQTVVSNQHGYFATYIHEADENLYHARWRLVRSTDGGSNFTNVLYRSCLDTAPLSDCPGGSAPVVETDRDGNIYLIYSDSNTNDAYFLRFLAANNYASPTVLTLPDGAAHKFSAVIDESRGLMYYAAANFKPSPPLENDNHTDTLWFFTIPLGGISYSRVRLTYPSRMVTSSPDIWHHRRALSASLSGRARSPVRRLD